MLSKTSTWLTGRSEMGKNFSISTSTLAILTRVMTGLVIATLIAVGLTSPSGGQNVRAESTSSSSQPQDEGVTAFARCLQDWDAGTHMTKQEWSGACQRLLLQRGDYLRKHPQ